MKKLIWLTLAIGTTACVPRGYIKDPSSAPVTKQDLAQIQQMIINSGTAIYQKIEAIEKKLSGPTPTPTPVSSPAQVK